MYNSSFDNEFVDKIIITNNKFVSKTITVTAKQILLPSYVARDNFISQTIPANNQKTQQCLLCKPSANQYDVNEKHVPVSPISLSDGVRL